YKNRHFSNDLKDQVQQDLQTALMETRSTPVEPAAETSTASGPDPGEASAAKKARSLLLSLYDEILMENTEMEQHLASPLSVKIQSYLLEAPIDRGENPLAYWRINKDRFPALVPLARAYLSAPCTSVDSERLFSLAGRVADDRRSRLSVDKTEMLLLFKKNLAINVQIVMCVMTTTWAHTHVSSHSEPIVMCRSIKYLNAAIGIFILVFSYLFYAYMANKWPTITHYYYYVPWQPVQMCTFFLVVKMFKCP
ncbi:hypothetical protein ABVT39_008164, partial [Epinephelus coioides]